MLKSQAFKILSNMYDDIAKIEDPKVVISFTKEACKILDDIINLSDPLPEDMRVTTRIGKLRDRLSNYISKLLTQEKDASGMINMPGPSLLQ